MTPGASERRRAREGRARLPGVKALHLLVVGVSYRPPIPRWRRSNDEQSHDRSYLCDPRAMASSLRTGVGSCCRRIDHALNLRFEPSAPPASVFVRGSLWVTGRVHSAPALRCSSHAKQDENGCSAAFLLSFTSEIGATIKRPTGKSMRTVENSTVRCSGMGEYLHHMLS